MPEESEGAQNRFYHYYEKYFAAKHSNAGAIVANYALMSLAQIHQIVGSADQKKGAQVMHRLMGLVLTEKQTEEMYYELRKDSGLPERS